MSDVKTGSCLVCGEPATFKCSRCSREGGLDLFYCSKEHQTLVSLSRTRLNSRQRDRYGVNTVLDHSSLTCASLDQMVDRSGPRTNLSAAATRIRSAFRPSRRLKRTASCSGSKRRLLLPGSARSMDAFTKLAGASERSTVGQVSQKQGPHLFFPLFLGSNCCLSRIA